MQYNLLLHLYVPQVPLGVIDRNETVTWEMASIMDNLQALVPKVAISTEQVQCQVFSKVLFGGDQLTSERARGAQRSRRSELLPEEQLRGLIPVAADWHAKQCLLQVRIIVLFNKKFIVKHTLSYPLIYSAFGGNYTRMDPVWKRAPFFNCGIYLVAHRLQRRSPRMYSLQKISLPLQLMQGHVIAAAMAIKNVAQLEDLSLSEGKTVGSLSQRIVDKFLKHTFFGQAQLPSDGVNLYARELMLMGLIWYSFKDAISEGDGPAVMKYWKVMTIMFKLTRHTK